MPEPVKALFGRLAARGVIFDPPYEHQADALEQLLGPAAGDLLVSTGTGSGKTETFLLPLLGRLYTEAAARPSSFQRRGIRALILYPMNALVNDQLARLRLLLGHAEVRAAFTEAAGRPAKFARYTGRTLYPGIRTKERNQRRLAPLKFYLKLLQGAAGRG